METLPSLHLFCKKSFQNVHYHDLDYLKGSKQLQIIPQDVSLTSNILNENTKVSFPRLKMFYDYLSKSEQTEKCRVILFNSPAKHRESATGIIDFAKILAQHGNQIADFFQLILAGPQQEAIVFHVGEDAEALIFGGNLAQIYGLEG